MHERLNATPKERSKMRFQYLIGAAALILVLGAAIWVGLQYIPH
jgi:hypothetical protein